MTMAAHTKKEEKGKRGNIIKDKKKSSRCHDNGSDKAK